MHVKSYGNSFDHCNELWSDDTIAKIKKIRVQLFMSRNLSF